MSSFSVVIPSRNPRNLHHCLSALLAREPDLPHERVIVIDDGGGPGAFQFPRVRVVPGDVPFVFARNCNIGIREAGGDDIVLLNDDALLASAGGLSKMAKAVADAPRLGFCSAAVVGRAHPDQFPLKDEAIRVVESMPNFACVLVPRATLDAVGLLDESLTGYSADDCDMALRVRRAGLDVCVYDGCVVFHEEGGPVGPTFTALPNFRELYEIGEELFARKWPDGPAEPPPTPDAGPGAP